jgi:16S rRNA (guanine(966)-N(2))-methyltransferase RsmD
MSIRIRGKRTLKTLPGQVTRPTTAKVRAAVFNIWQFEIPGCRWLDLCAGSGSMGAEALTRGATTVVGIEQLRRACQLIQANWEQIHTPDQRIQVITAEVVTALRSLPPAYDRIYLDPPYASDVYIPCLELISQRQLLATGGAIAAEHAAVAPLPLSIGDLVQTQCRSYGKTSLSFYTWNA